jgi:hypothetical protein
MNAKKEIDKRIQQLEQEVRQERKNLIGQADKIFSLAGIVSTSLASGRELGKLWGQKGALKKAIKMVLKRMALGGLLKMAQQIIAVFLQKKSRKPS